MSVWSALSVFVSVSPGLLSISLVHPVCQLSVLMVSSCLSGDVLCRAWLLKPCSLHQSCHDPAEERTCNKHAFKFSPLRVGVACLSSFSVSIRDGETTIKIKFCFFFWGGGLGGREENRPKCCFAWETSRR